MGWKVVWFSSYPLIEGNLELTFSLQFVRIDSCCVANSQHTRGISQYNDNAGSHDGDHTFVFQQSNEQLRLIYLLETLSVALGIPDARSLLLFCLLCISFCDVFYLNALNENIFRQSASLVVIQTSLKKRTLVWGKSGYCAPHTLCIIFNQNVQKMRKHKARKV